MRTEEEIMHGDASKGRRPAGGLVKRRFVRELVGATAGLALLIGVFSAFAPHRQQVEAAPAVATATAPIATGAGMLTAQQIIAAFQAEGLTVENVRREPQAMGGPSGPPMTEREAWAFSVPEVAPSGGRIMIFAEDDKLHKKEDWFKRVGAETKIVAYKNVILWLDPGISPAETARFRKALKGLV